LFFEWDLVHWLPYGSYGMLAALQQVISLGPLDYVAGFFGTGLRIHDAMLLFTLARIGEVMVFAFGIWMPARRFFTECATAIALGIAAAGTTVWYAQVWFDLRFYYLLPLVLCCVHRFLDERRLAWFWLAGVTIFAWSVGNVPYFIPMWGFSLLCIVVPIALGHGDAWARLLRPSRAGLLWFALFAASAAIFVYASFDALNFLVIRASPAATPLRGRSTSRPSAPTAGMRRGSRPSLRASCSGRRFIFPAAGAATTAPTSDCCRWSVSSWRSPASGVRSSWALCSRPAHSSGCRWAVSSRRSSIAFRSSPSTSTSASCTGS